MLGDLANHIWQSTIFAIAAGLMTLALRKNRAQVRYWLWLSASLKFLLPSSLLTSIASRLEWAPAAQQIASMPAIADAMVHANRPFSEGLVLMPDSGSAHDWTLIAILGAWACGFAAILVMRIQDWRRIRASVRSSTPVAIRKGIEIRSVPRLLEPSVVGLFRPVLLMPTDITERLQPSQLDAVLAHELCHVQRRDNLTAALHMIVEAIFWFHPMVWWIGKRLIEERERACDEAVLSLGSTPHDYAAGILRVCESYLETPLSCVSGVTGSSLKKRIRAIMTGHVASDLNFVRKLALAVAGGAVLTIPIVVGMIGAPRVQAQSKVAPPSIALQLLELKPGRRRPVAGFPDRATSTINAGYLKVQNASLRDLIERAYRLRNFQIAGGPAWIDSHDYEVIAKASDTPSSQNWGRALGPIFQTLLQERFQLRWHFETRKIPVYVLTVAQGGNRLRRSKKENCDSFFFTTYPKRKLPNKCGAVAAVNSRLNMQLSADGMKIDPGLARFLSGFIVHRPVIDKTGLTGRYDFRLEWNVAATRKALGETGPATGAGAVSIFTALGNQLGLKLNRGKGPVRVFVVDDAERPVL